MKNNKYMPIMLAACVVIGILLGTFYANHFSGNRLNIIGSGSNRLTNLLNIINDQYVDKVDIDSLVEESMPMILAELDPHSAYISAKDAQEVNDELKGSFSGVGIMFTIRDDTIRVQEVISNGPSEKVGIVAGDKIVSVNDTAFVGEQVTNTEAMRRLKGPKGSKVKIGVVRYGEKKVRSFTVTRADIPVKSVPVAYMIDETTGYIRIKNFGETTYPEMLVALTTLSERGAEKLIVDLRDNTGGYMQSAVQIVNEFLPKNKLIVYMQGRKSPRKDYYSDGRGSYQDIPLVVLINEASASASEIFAGAIQDNDRGTIVGRRSFGKGLVQQQIEFPDKSMVRLTVARYYTPSGRCIQKPYTKGQSEEYENDLVERYRHGEFFSQDSIKHDGPEYHTESGRVVYGGGGITPDIFVSEDTTNMTSYYKEAAMSGLILQFSFEYTDNNRQKLKEYDSLDKLLAYLKRQNIVDKFATYADSHGLKRRNLLIAKSRKMLERFLYSRIVYNLMDEEAWNEYLNRDDETVMAAMKKLNSRK